ncbi:hypothetical protein LTR84_012758 [Exophiala bonariae]|uniref:FAD dependent oxidoreductase domain-containing protein n=1 Tax=Exophiala bonariae TaxID=1690606 RepID=A0AAV9NFB9_9EURO|nr:hypothetical protein LTR84_012758 [Exophiala bonariae]
MSSDRKTIIVIGAGVLGLTAAISLQKEYADTRDILLIARDWPSDESIRYTSPWAGAHGRPIPATTPIARQHQAFANETHAMMKALSQQEPACGVEFMDGYDFIACPSDNYVNLTGGYGDAEGLIVLDKNEFPNDMGITFGSKYRTWSLNSPVYCTFLLRKFRLRGGKTLKATLTTAEEAFSRGDYVDTVVNCSGFGFGDPEAFPVRVSNPCDRTITQQNPDGTWTFIIPRPLDGGTVIGGTREPHDWTETARPETRAKVLEMAAKMYPPILGPGGKFNVIRDIVGRRPARVSGLRLETEFLKGHFRGKRIIHAYGAEGHGYGLSWGVAREVVRMALEAESSVAVRPSL